MVYFVDIDDTICKHDSNIPLDGNRDYSDAIPIKENIDKINNLYDQGHDITYWTARGSRSGKDWLDFTKKQLDEWGCKYHNVRADKPYYDKFIEDRSLFIEDVKIFISHRGNILGEIPELENKPDYIDEAISAGYDVEIDVRYIDGIFWLGHDEAEYEISLEFLTDRADKLWIHAKDTAALSELLNYPELRVFYHAVEDQTIISDGHIWTHNLDEITSKSIIPLMDDSYDVNYFKQDFYGVCSDYIEHYKQEYLKL